MGNSLSFYVIVVGKITRSLPPCSKMVKNRELEHVLWCAEGAGGKVWLSDQWCLHPVELRRRQLQWSDRQTVTHHAKGYHTQRRAVRTAQLVRSVGSCRLPLSVPS